MRTAVRVLGGLDSEGAAGVVNQLLLAATLEENGWTVEHEPPVDGRTPTSASKSTAARSSSRL
jgi:hypothetical protein